MPTLDFLIPARNEKYLQKTIDDVLAHTGETTGIIVVLDGAWPMQPIPDNPRVTIIHHTEPRGQRASINEAARISRADFICKLDAHCSVAPGFDSVMLAAWESGELTEKDTALGRMYNLDPERWEPKLHKRTDYMYMALNEKGELRAEYYSRQPDTAKELDETMSCMGPCFMLSRDRFWQTGGCDEGHGGAAGWGAQSVEVSCKAWLSGGRLMVNKRTWFAHHFRGDTGFPYPISGREIQRVRQYSKDLWLNDKWPGQVRPFEWLVRHFNPPGWEGYKFKAKANGRIWTVETGAMAAIGEPYLEEKPRGALKPLGKVGRDEVQHYLYHRIHHQRHHPTWRGVPCIKFAEDLLIYHRALWETRPEVIVEIGTRHGGTALFLQDQLDLLEPLESGERRQVVTVDIKDQVAEKDPRIAYLLGDSTSEATIHQVETLALGRRTMVILDGDHRRVKVKWEMHHYARLVSPGCYLVVEDCYIEDNSLYGPGEARDWFLTSNEGRRFEQTNLDQELAVGVCVGGWLRRKA